eukprot:2027297-Pyramimonas_sp.AAC.1
MEMRLRFFRCAQGPGGLHMAHCCSTGWGLGRSHQTPSSRYSCGVSPAAAALNCAVHDQPRAQGEVSRASSGLEAPPHASASKM